jgi:hypothetical protein
MNTISKTNKTTAHPLSPISCASCSPSKPRDRFAHWSLPSSVLPTILVVYSWVNPFHDFSFSFIYTSASLSSSFSCILTRFFHIAALLALWHYSFTFQALVLFETPLSHREYQSAFRYLYTSTQHSLYIKARCPMLLVLPWSSFD